MMSISLVASFLLALSTSNAVAKPAKTLPVYPNVDAAMAARAEAKQDVVLEIDGRIYPKDTFPSSCGDLLKGGKCTVESFGHYHVEARKEGDLVHSIATFAGPEGTQVIENSWERDGHVQKARIENRALGKASELEVRGKKIYYKVTEKDGTVKEADDDYEENLVVPSTVMSYIRPHFKKIEAGESVRLRVAVLDRREAFTFYIKKYREEKSPDGKDILVLQMAPGSIIVKALVDPMYFFINPKTGEMFAFEGRSALRRKVGDKYKEMDVRAAYDYKVNAYNLLSAKNDATQSESCSAGSLLGTGKDAKCEVKSQ